MGCDGKQRFDVSVVPPFTELHHAYLTLAKITYTRDAASSLRRRYVNSECFSIPCSDADDVFILFCCSTSSTSHPVWFLSPWCMLLHMGGVFVLFLFTQKCVTFTYMTMPLLWLGESLWPGVNINKCWYWLEREVKVKEIPMFLRSHLNELFKWKEIEILNNQRSISSQLSKTATLLIKVPN